MTSKFKRTYTRIEDLHKGATADIKTVDNTVHTVKGWIAFSRPQAKMMFIQMSDGSCMTPLQLIFGDKDDVVRKIVEPKAHIGAYIEATGVIIKSIAKGQLIEMKVTSAEVKGEIADPKTFLPGIKNVSIDTVAQHPDLRTMMSVFRSIYRIRSRLNTAVHEFMHKNKVHHVEQPSITASDCEGAGETFTVTTLLADDIKDIPLVKGTTKIDYSQDTFGKKVGLTVSGQLHLETVCRGLGDVYTMGPSFRAEKSNTKRHLSAFTHLEWELMGIDDINTLMDFSEDLVVYCIECVLEDCMEDLEVLEKTIAKGVIAKLTAFIKSTSIVLSYDRLISLGRITEKQVIEVLAKHKDDVIAFSKGEMKELPKVVADISAVCKKWIAEVYVKEPAFARITYDEAIDVLTKNKEDVLKYADGELKKLPEWGDDLGSVCEKWLSEFYTQKPTFVYNYPLDLKAFYMKPNAPVKVMVDGKEIVRQTVQSIDLLVPGLGELIGSSARNTDYKSLMAEVEKRKMDASPITWYSGMRLNGTFPHGGAGLGFDRLVTICTSGLDGGNIRMVVPYPVAYKECHY